MKGGSPCSKLEVSDSKKHQQNKFSNFGLNTDSRTKTKSAYCTIQRNSLNIQYIHLSVTFPRDNPCYQFRLPCFVIFPEDSLFNQLLQQLVHFRHQHLHPCLAYLLAYLLAYHLAYLLAYHLEHLQQQHTIFG